MIGRKAFFFGKKKQKAGRITLRPCPGLTRVSTRGPRDSAPETDALRVCAEVFADCRVDARVKPGA